MSEIRLNENLEENSNSLSPNSSFKYFETSKEEQESFISFISNKEEDNSIFEEYIYKKINCYNGLSFINKFKSNFNNINNDNNENIGEIKDLNLSDNFQKENFLLNKKKKIFEVVTDTKNFIVFSFGEYDKESRKIINETLDDIKNGKIKNFFLDESELPKIPHRKRKNIIARKENSDNITKKIKTRFLKALKNKINEKLKIAGSKYYFKYLPQAFISDLSKVKNNSILNMTYKEILTNNFIKWRKSDLNGINNYLYNKSVLEYLENNKDTFKNLNYNIFNMTYSQLYKEYFESKEFEIEIASLTKIENLKYIKNYIVKANNFIKFFSKNNM